jgi:phosphatidate cytidylyltransferase
MLKQRILTAIILIPLVFISILYTSPAVFRFILAIVLLVAAWEWNTLSGIESTPRRFLCLLLLAVCFWLSSLFPQGMVIGLGVVWWLWATYRLVMQQFNQPFVIKHERYIGILIFTTCWISFSFLRDQNQNWVIMLLLIVWLADTAAYFIGRRFGQHFLAPQISPKKTREGAYGALLAVFVAILLGGLIMELQVGFLAYLALLGLITASISIVGDLFESLLKRQAGTKDSGQLLPGHGGLLDRIDGLLAAAPFFAGGVFLLYFALEKL